MITDMGTTTIPSCWTSSGGMDAALSVTTVTVMWKGSLRPWGGNKAVRVWVLRGPLGAGLGHCHGGGDVGHVAEALGEVTEQLVGTDVELLGEQAQIVGGGHRLVEDASGIVEAPLAGQALDEPERAGDE